jgi:hypothetical protein
MERMTAAQQATVQHAGQLDVGPVEGAPGDLVDAVVTDRPGADYFVSLAHRGGTSSKNAVLPVEVRITESRVEATTRPADPARGRV